MSVCLSVCVSHVLKIFIFSQKMSFFHRKCHIFTKSGRSNKYFFTKFFKKIDVFCQIRCFFGQIRSFSSKIFFAKNRCFFGQIRCFLAKFELFQKKIFFAKFNVFSSNLKFFKKKYFLPKIDVFWPNSMFFGHIFTKSGYIRRFFRPRGSFCDILSKGSHLSFCSCSNC